MLTIRLDSAVPLVDQLVAGLRVAIARRQVRRGDALPTVRQLAADLGIHMNTVSRAYRALEADGLVATARGRGTVVSAERSRPAADPAAARAELRRGLAAALAEARLAGLERAEVETWLRDDTDSLWTEDPS